MRRVVNDNPKQTSAHGQKTNMGHFGKHLGYDYGVPVGTPVKAPVAGKITLSSWSNSLGNWIELAGVDGRTHRVAHLSRRDVSNNQQVTEGQQLGLSGKTGVVTGPHVHHDARKAGTTWDASFDNYVDWEELITPPSAPSKMPTAGSKVQLVPVQTRTTFRSGTTTVAGQIKATDNSYIYTVRGYDPKYPGRIIINSASAGGDGVALALYFTNGQVIPGWKVL